MNKDESQTEVSRGWNAACKTVLWVIVAIAAVCFVAVVVQPARAASPSTVTVELPNPVLTPGDVNPDATLSELCDVGFVRKARNATKVMSANLKLRVAKNYGVTEDTGICAVGQGCAIDFLVPLELGGTHDVKNLWVQPLSNVQWTYTKKNELEIAMHGMVCSKAVDLKRVQKEIATDWVSAYQKYVGRQ